MLNEIELENFKSIGRRITLDFKNLTLYSGLNSSGKSSVYQSLLVLAQSISSFRKLEDRLFPILSINGDRIKIGQKDEAINSKDNKEITFSLTWEKGEVLELKYKLLSLPNMHGEEFFLTRTCLKKKGVDAWLVAELGTKDLTWNIRARNYLEIGSQELARVLDKHLSEFANKNAIGRERFYKEEVEFPDVKNVFFHSFGLAFFEIDFYDLKKCVDDSLIGVFDQPELKKDIDKMIIDKRARKSVLLYNNYKDYDIEKFFIADLEYIPPFRGLPSRLYTEGGLNPNPLKNWEKDGGGRIKYCYDFDTKEVKEGSINQALKYWVSSKFNFADDVIIESVIPDYSTEIFFTTNGRKIPINNMGFGLSQVIPVIYNTLCSSSTTFTIIDEPEIHLHPKSQAILGDFFAQMAMIGKKIVIETHSEYLINRLISLSIMHPSVKNNIGLYWVERDSSGSSSLREVRYDELGYLISPPDEFLTTNTDEELLINNFRFEKVIDD